MAYYPPDDPQNGMIPPGFGQGMQGMFGGLKRGFRGGANALNPYSNRLLAFSAGMLGGGPAGAAKGLIVGSALDRESADRKRLNEAIAGLKGQSGVLSGLNEADWNYLSAAGPEAMSSAFTEGLKGPDYGEKYKGYLQAKAEGYPSDWMQYQQDIKDSGDTITIGAGETAGAKAQGELFAKRYSNILDAGDTATDSLYNLDIMQQAAADPNLYTGVGGETVANLKATAQSLGFNVTGTDSAQVLQSFSRQMTMRLRNPDSGGGLPGSVSNQDRNWLQSIPPGLQDTPGTLARKMEIMRKLERRKQEIAELAAQYAESSPSGQLDNGWTRYQREWVEAHPLFAGEPPLTDNAEFSVGE